MSGRFTLIRSECEKNSKPEVLGFFFGTDGCLKLK